MTERQEMVRELDSLTRKILFIKQGGRCYITGCTRPATDNAHIISRGAMATRWDMKDGGNCHLLCRQCHALDHANELDPSYVDVFISRNGEDAFENLRRRANSFGTFSDTGIGTILATRQAEWESLIEPDPREKAKS